MGKRRHTIHTELEEFMQEWESPSPTITVHTSGSTGEPKCIEVSKKRMEASARLTLDYLGIRPRRKALLCMPLRYIAGKMMVVRSIVGNLRLVAVQPKGHPLADLDEPIDFAAMVPLQVFNSLKVSRESKRIKQIKHLLIGGGSIDKMLEFELRSFPNPVYSTYGMTETLSHIAIRRINGKNASLYYTPLPSVNLSLSEEQTLIIDAPLVASEKLVTNDVVEMLPDGRFRVLGRKDNIINTGGIKVQTEQFEAQLYSYLRGPYAITSVPDPQFGEAIVLMITDLYPFGEEIVLKMALREEFPRYMVPKHILLVPKIPLTETSKIDRVACRQLATSMISTQQA